MMSYEKLRGPAALIPAALVFAAGALSACQSSTNRAVPTEAARALPAGSVQGQASPGKAAAAPGQAGKVKGSGGAVTASAPAAASAGAVGPSSAGSSSEVDSTGAEGDKAAGVAARGAPSSGGVPDATVSWPKTVEGTTDIAVARVGNRDVPLTDLVSKWIMRDPNGVRAILDDLIISRLVVLEAASYGIELPDGVLEGEIGSRLRALESSAKKAGAPSLEVYIQKRLGLNQQTFLRELEHEAAVDLLAPRCIRSWLLSSDRREIRAITVKDEAACDQVQARLARGDAFADVAKELSTDPSAKEGGRMPPVVRGDQALARTAFAAQVGSVSGPMPDEKGFVFLLVEGAPKGENGPWSQVGGSIEASLKTRGIEDPEFWQWKDAMFQRYDIDVTPFLELAGR